ncbi:MAG: hypothetical protein LUQ54_00595 [Methanoregula sp.]|nr:hypothetical protein [Methanoregula sp.]
MAILLVAALLIVSVCIAGCSMNQGTPAPTTIPTTVQTVPPITTAEPTPIPVTTTVVTTAATTAPTEKVVLHETGVLTTKTYMTYDFKTLMGYKFLYPKDKFRVTIKSEQPVLGYALSTLQAGQLAALSPRYQSYIKGGIDWGLIEPVMVIEKATDTTKEFTLTDTMPLTYVVDGRWMGYESVYANTGPFKYEITIVKTGGPTKQSFDFAGYDSNASISSKTVETIEQN